MRGGRGRLWGSCGEEEKEEKAWLGLSGRIPVPGCGAGGPWGRPDPPNGKRGVGFCPAALSRLPEPWSLGFRSED